MFLCLVALEGLLERSFIAANRPITAVTTTTMMPITTVTTTTVMPITAVTTTTMVPIIRAFVFRSKGPGDKARVMGRRRGEGEGQGRKDIRREKVPNALLLYIELIG